MTFIHSPPIPWRMANPYADQRNWLQDLLKARDLSPTDLARRAGLNPSTLTRFLQGSRDGHMLSARTVRKIEAVAAEPRRPQPSMSHAEDDGSPWFPSAKDDAGLADAVRALQGSSNAVEAWHIESDELQGLRLFRGDVVLVDQSADARVGDIVCAKVHDYRANRARFVFRLYEPPYLLNGNAVGPYRRPETVDGRDVVIQGVVMARLSPRRLLS